MARLLSMALSTPLLVALVTTSTTALADGPKQGAATATALAQDSAPKPKPKPVVKHKAKALASAKPHGRATLASKHHAAKHKATAQAPRHKR